MTPRGDGHTPGDQPMKPLEAEGRPTQPPPKPSDIRSVPPEPPEPTDGVGRIGAAPTDDDAPTATERDEAVIAALWSVANLAESAARALENWSMRLAPVSAGAQAEPQGPQPWRCPECEARVQALRGGRYGCARTHAPVYATDAEMAEEFKYNQTVRQRPDS